MITTRNKKLRNATEIFNILLSSRYLENLIDRKLSEFDEDYTDTSKEVIATLVASHKKDFNTKLITFRPWNLWFSSIKATTYSGNYELIRVNKYNISCWQSLVGTIGHEWGHCFEYYIKQLFPDRRFKFDHGGPGGNSPDGKENTFQYWLGSMIKLEMLRYKSYTHFMENVYMYK